MVVLLKAMVILSLVVGSAGGAAAATANSLPDSPLYAAKMAMEQARLSATSDPAGQAAVHTALARARVQEMIRMAQDGDAPDEAVQLRLRQHLNLAFQLAAGLGDEEMAQALEQLREMAQDQERALEQARVQAGEPVE
ncbi:MAG: DUF5667 domain-containing protein, partial [Anaerolineae bacterium]